MLGRVVATSLISKILLLETTTNPGRQGLIPGVIIRYLFNSVVATWDLRESRRSTNTTIVSVSEVRSRDIYKATRGEAL
jgi:hypothetical protein